MCILFLFVSNFYVSADKHSVPVPVISSRCTTVVCYYISRNMYRYPSKFGLLHNMLLHIVKHHSNMYRYPSKFGLLHKMLLIVKHVPIQVPTRYRYPGMYRHSASYR